MSKIMYCGKLRSWQDADDAMGGRWRSGCKLDPHPFTLTRIPTFDSSESSYSVRWHHDPLMEFVRYWPDGKIRLGDVHKSLPLEDVMEAVNRFSPFTAEVGVLYPPLVIRWPEEGPTDGEPEINMTGYIPGMLWTGRRGWIAPGAVMPALTPEQREALNKRAQGFTDRYRALVARQKMREAVEVDMFGHDEDDVS